MDTSDKQAEAPVFRILSIDGGGIKGVLPASFLATLEEQLERPIGQYFDLIAGTSTGGIIAIGLAMGIPAKDLLTLYTERGPRIFGQAEHGFKGRLADCWRNFKHTFTAKHDADLLREELEAVLEDRRIGDAQTRLLIPAWDADHRSVYIYKTAHHERLKHDYRLPAVDAAMATAAAPTYYRRHRTAEHVGLLDGGIWANNPVALAVVEAITLLGWPSDRLQVLSLGCGSETYMLGEAPGWGSLAWDATRLFFDGQSHGANGMAMLLTGHEHARDAIYRYCPAVPKDFFKLDDTRRASQLSGMGASAARKARPKLDPVFFAQPIEPFEPVYSLEGDYQ